MGLPEAGLKAPRRAMIRRRGKRGRIGRAGAIEAYENRTQLTNDARKRSAICADELLVGAVQRQSQQGEMGSIRGLYKRR
jgi:hypothetical protein